MIDVSVNSDFNIKYLRKYLCLLLLVYFLLAAFFLIRGYREPIPFYMELCRIILFVHAASMIMLAFIIKNVKYLLIANVLVYLIVVLFIKHIYSHELLDYFGNAIDSYSYLNYSIKYGDEPLSFFLKKLEALGYYRDDWGYFLLLRFFYQIYPEVNFVIYSAVIVNTIAIYISSVFIYKLQLLLTDSDEISRITSVFYSSSAFLVVTTVNGLKEVLFLMLIILAMYYIYRLREKFSYHSLFLVFLYSGLCIFFRTAVFYMLIVALIVSLTVNAKNKKLYLYMMIIGLLFVGTLLPYIIESFMGTTIDDVTYTAEHRISIRGYNNSIYSQIVPILSAILGPFPQLDRMGTYAFIHSLTPFFKCTMSSMFIMGVVTVVKGLKEDYFPILVYVFFSIYMTVLAGVSLDFRYHLTYFPFFIILSFNFFTKRKLIDFGYIAVAVFLIYMYSSRNMFGG